MTILRAEILGYCMGVRRAVEAAELACAENVNKKVYTLGPLIHNNSALKALEKMGVGVLSADASDLSADASDCVVIIRAHGVPPVIMKKLENSKCKVINATCPRVLSSQKRAADFGKKGYTVLLAGDKNHGEVVGISGCARASGAECTVIENHEEAANLNPLPEQAILLSQTTISSAEYENIANVLKEKIPNLKVANTICPATQERQKALVELCRNVDGVLIIGGKNSANTKRLLRTAQELCPNAALIETADEIPADFFRLKRVGLSAGASTPDFVIDAVEEALNEGCIN